jgi:hypothetical protein
MAYEFKIATTLGGLTLLQALTTPVLAPYWSYRPYRESTELIDHSVRGFGPAAVGWRWGFLTNAQRDQLRTFCPGDSAEIYIRTKKLDSDDSYTNMKVRMVWPAEENPQAKRKLEFTLSFIVLAEGL